jgi:hypothetical protein
MLVGLIAGVMLFILLVSIQITETPNKGILDLDIVRLIIYLFIFGLLGAIGGLIAEGVITTFFK